MKGRQGREVQNGRGGEGGRGVADQRAGGRSGRRMYKILGAGWEWLGRACYLRLSKTRRGREERKSWLGGGAQRAGMGQGV